MNEKRLWRLRHAEMGMRTWMPSKESIQKGMNSIFAPNPWYYELRKEVRKEMAIDYKEQWEKFQVCYGQHYIQAKVGSPKSTLTLNNLMDTWISNAILGRERLMNEYVKTRIQTEIIGGDQHCHKVKLIVRGQSRGTIPVGKDAFQAWIKREKGGKCNEVF